MEAPKDDINPPGFTQPPQQKGANMLQDVYNIPKGEGQVVIQFPPNMSKENFEDFTDWFILQHRKMGRSVEDGNVPKLVRDDASQKSNLKTGPKAERLKLEGDWKDAMTESLKKKRPESDWPDTKKKKKKK